MTAVKQTIAGTLSTGGWQRRVVRLAMVAAGGVLTVTGVHDGITWGELGKLMLLPVPFLGAFVALCGAILSSGLKHNQRR